MSGLRRLRRSLSSGSLPWFLTGVLATLLATSGLAIAGTDPETFTGCLKGGVLGKVALGEAPLRPCARGETQVSWTSDSGLSNVQIGTASIDTTGAASAAVGPDTSPEIVEAETVTIEGGTITWTIGPGDFVDSNPGDGEEVGWFQTQVTLTPDIPITTATAVAITISGVAHLPTVSRYPNPPPLGRRPYYPLECWWISWLDSTKVLSGPSSLAPSRDAVRSGHGVVWEDYRFQMDPAYYGPQTGWETLNLLARDLPYRSLVYVDSSASSITMNLRVTCFSDSLTDNPSFAPWGISSLLRPHDLEVFTGPLVVDYSAKVVAFGEGI